MSFAMSTQARAVVLGLCFVSTAVFAARAMPPDLPLATVPIEMIPVRIADWTGRAAPPFTAEIRAALGVDAYVDRIYESPGSGPVSLFVGYYASQRTGDTIHSPQNCLPGAGWLPVKSERVSIAATNRPDGVIVNRLLIQKGLEKQVVFYWYQSRGRVVASDYWSKVHLVYNAMRHHRSDAAIVRVIAPVMPGDSVDAAGARGAAFVGTLLPALDAVLPS